MATILNYLNFDLTIIFRQVSPVKEFPDIYLLLVGKRSYGGVHGRPLQQLSELLLFPLSVIRKQDDSQITLISLENTNNLRLSRPY